MQMHAKTHPPDGSGKTRVVIVDPHPPIHDFFQSTLGKRPEYEIVAEGRTAADALRLCTEFEPRLLILELALPDLSGATVVAEVHASRPGTRTLIYTGSSNERALIDALRAKPHGLLRKDDSLPGVWHAIGLVARGGSFTSAAFGRLAERAAGDFPGVNLTPRERSVLQSLAQGFSNKEIAERLNMALKTVEHHRASIMKNTGLHDVASLTRLAMAMGLGE